MAKKNTKPKKTNNTDNLNERKKQVSIIGIGEVGIKALYKLSELNFTSYETIKYETREEFKAFNDDYSFEKNNIKKSKLIVVLADLEDKNLKSYLERIMKDGKSKTNLVVLISEIKYKGMYDDIVDTIVYFKKDEIIEFNREDMSDCLGIITTCGLAPTLSPSPIEISLNDLIVILKNKKTYYFGYKKGLKSENKEILNEAIRRAKLTLDFTNIIITFWSNKSISILEVNDLISDLEKEYLDKVIIVGYTIDIENNKETEINVIIG